MLSKLDDVIYCGSFFIACGTTVRFHRNVIKIALATLFCRTAAMRRKNKRKKQKKMIVMMMMTTTMKKQQMKVAIQKKKI